MILTVLRALFVLLMAAAGYMFLSRSTALGDWTWLSMMVALTLGVLIVCVDILAPRKKLTVFSGTFFGLIVGICIAFALSFVVRLLVEQVLVFYPRALPPGGREEIIGFLNLTVGIICSYLAISFILQTKDDFRFVIPYVEFSKQTKGARPILLDTSVLIDGRITDVAATGILESQLVVPRFILSELQKIADNSEKLKRNRGKRGLDVLAKLQGMGRNDVAVYDTADRDGEELLDVDQRLINLAENLNGRILTNDVNLSKVAQLRGVDVISINDLANALKPVVLPGEKMHVRLLKAGEEAGQGVGYLEDGTMVVVEQGRPHLNEEVELTVTSVLQTSAGRMIFGRMSGNGAAPPPPRGRGRPGREERAAG